MIQGLVLDVLVLATESASLRGSRKIEAKDMLKAIKIEKNAIRALY